MADIFEMAVASWYSLDLVTISVLGLFSFCVVFVKSFQMQNIVGGHKVQAALLSTVISGIYIVEILLVSTKGIAAFVPISIGASAGVVLSMSAYQKFNGRHRNARQT